MRNYLFIDLHIHSTYSYETGCDASPREILDNSLVKAEQVKQSMKEKIDDVIKNEPDKFNDLLREYCRYFADTVEDQKKIYKEIISCDNQVEKLKEKLDKETKCCISITDHQNIKGSAEAVDVIEKNKDKYKMIEFIPGIEVNAGLRCIGKNKGSNFSAYKKCHALAYGYDIEDKTLNAYSNLYHYTAGKIEVGKMVLLARKRIEDIYGIKIPLKDIAYVVENNPTANQVRKRFYKYLTKEYSEVDIRQIRCEDNTPCFNFLPKGNDNAISGSKWELDEYMLAIDNAGGKFSVAHPYSIKNKIIEQEQTYYNNEFIKELVRVTNDKSFEILKNEKLKVDIGSKSKNAKNSTEKGTKTIIKDIVKKINKENNKKYSAEEIYQAYIEYMYGRNIERFVRKVIKIRKRLNIGDNEFGFEIFNKINLSGAKSKILYDIATKYNLFLTGGSDHHGNLYLQNPIGKCFDKDFIESTDKDLFEMENSELQKKIDITLASDFNNMLTQMPFIDFVKDNKIPQIRQEIKFYNIPNGIIKFNNDLFDRHRTWIVKPEWTPENSKKYLNTKGINHISRMEFDYILNGYYFLKSPKIELEDFPKASRQTSDYNIKLDNKKVSTIKYDEGYCWGD